MDFKKDIQEYIKGEFEYLGLGYIPSIDIHLDLLNLFTIHKKYVNPFKRQVKFSKELLTKLEHSKYKGVIMHLKLLFLNQGDVNPFQSKNLFNFKMPDYLVYDWNIYHFHLSNEKINDGFFNARTKYVLFVYVTNDQALFLDIDKHPPNDAFADKHLLEIIDNNWSGKLLEVNGIKGLSHNLNSSERYLLRKKGVNEGIVEVNGRFIFSPDGGSATSGHSIQETQKLMQFKRWLRINEEKIHNSKIAIDKYFSNIHGLKNPIDYKLVFTKNGPQIHDLKSETCFVKYNEIITI